jgi:hypothetical protein
MFKMLAQLGADVSHPDEVGKFVTHHYYGGISDANWSQAPLSKY